MFGALFSAMRLAAHSIGGMLGGVVKSVGTLFQGGAMLAAKVTQAATQDGTLAAAGRMGLDELGTALKPFPESIQTQESGSIWNPTQGEIAASRQSMHGGMQGHSSTHTAYSPPHPWPSEVAKERQHDAGQDRSQGQEQSPSAGHSM
jgi:cystathionine beta-lyase family protein involved in aluminum resistance